jgi:ubiquinone/menaquinone biosynthesis C-methylase UbiE
MAGQVNYDDRQFAVYAKGRAMSPATRDMWMTVFASHVPPRRPLAVLDLGCGIGRFTPALAGTFGGPVYGVEPSTRMRQIAAQSAAHPAVRYLAGRTEAIPLRAGSCDVVLMCLVIHHVEDLAAGVAEIGRVLRPGARLRLRPFSTFEHMTEEEIAAGMAALDAAVAREPEPHPIEGTSDLLVLGPPELA